MGASAMTLGEFIALVEDPEDLHTKLWIRDCRQEAGEAKWTNIGSLPLTAHLVLELSRWFIVKIQEELDHWSEEELYMETLRCGHAFLRRVHGKAVERGIQIELKLIDTPITPSEMMVAAGLMARGEDGSVRLSRQGEKVAEEVGRVLHAGDN